MPSGSTTSKSPVITVSSGPVPASLPCVGLFGSGCAGPSSSGVTVMLTCAVSATPSSVTAVYSNSTRPA